ncbi:MAG: hypothetical protein WCT16_04335 [Candidatus Buchananbacteria bacterium]
MKNIATLSIIFLCVLVIGFGVYQKFKPANQDAAPVEQQSAAPSSISAITASANETPATAQTAVTAPASGQTAAAPAASKHYYPDQTATQLGGSGSSAVSAGSKFTITPQLIAKMHLVDKYKPGICYGSAIVVPEVAIQSMIADNKDLAEFLRQKYSLKTDLEVYNKIKQLNGIMLTETASSKYDFRFMDGQCCAETLYLGAVSVSGETATDVVTSQESYTEKC